MESAEILDFLQIPVCGFNFEKSQLERIFSDVTKGMVYF